MIAARAYGDPGTFASEMAVLRRVGWQMVGLTEDFPPGAPPVDCPLFGQRISIRQVATGHEGSWSDEAEQTPAPRVSAVGRFVFATGASEGELAAYLGPYADYLRAVSPLLGDVILSESAEVAANWKLFVEITLDDYHLDTIHPTTFGAAKAIESHRLVYRRDGPHSCYLRRRDAHWSFDGFWRDLPSGVVDRMGYKIFQVFPSALVMGMYECVIAGAVHPLTAGRSLVTNRVIAWTDRVSEEAARRELAAFLRAVFREDRDACEQWQTSVGQLARAPTLGRLEERVAWFHEAYEEVMAGSRPARGPLPR